VSRLVTGDRQTAVRVVLAVGGVLGVAAGLAQAGFGSRIPTWTGAKAEPLALGLLTITLSLVAAAGAWAWRRPDQLLPPTVAVICASIGFSTVGRLWYLPGPLILAAALAGVRDWRAAAHRTRDSWTQILLAVLGCCDLLLAAAATPWITLTAATSGAALLTAAVLIRGRSRPAVALVVLGTVPFALIAWTALVPVLVLVLALSLLALTRRVGAPRLAG
jgi:hypothetical protein